MTLTKKNLTSQTLPSHLLGIKSLRSGGSMDLNIFGSEHDLIKSIGKYN